MILRKKGFLSWRRGMKKLTAAGLLLSFTLFQSVSAYAQGIGPGVQNLSPSDNLSIYQWGLQNDGRLSLDVTSVNMQSMLELYKSRADWDKNGGIGIPPRSIEPSDFNYSNIKAVSGVDINYTEAREQYDADGSERRDVIVALIDTGVDTEHAELVNSIWTNEDEIPGDGIDNDGNGYIDDVHGWNFYDNNNRVRYNKIADRHGTHSAGTIAAQRGNGGITGIADNAHVKIMVLKVLDENGAGNSEAVVNAIRYAEANGASICNMSLGTTQYIPEIEDIIASSSMLFVAAAGNGDQNGIGYNTDVSGVYPASYSADNIISVANLMFDGSLDTSSNYGPETVDIAAPGSYILSTAPGNRFEFLSGTSMAAPMVTGLAAFVYSYRTDLDLMGVKDAILNTAKKLDSLAGKIKTGGIPDAYAAINYNKPQPQVQ